MSRAANDAEWNLQKARICDLYVSQKKSLPDVIDIMKTHHNFDKTKSQYENYFRKWNIRKNLKAKDWELIAKDGRKRKALELDSDPCFEGVRIPKAKLRREMKRHELTAYQRFELRHHKLLQIRDRIFKSAELTPWFNFMGHIQHFNAGPSGSTALFGTQILPGTTASAMPVSFIAIAFQERSHNLLQNDESLHKDDFGQIELHFQHPGRYFPPRRNGTLDIDPPAIKDLSHRNNQLELLKLAVRLLSDNADAPQLVSSIVELAEHSGYRSALRRLLSQRLLSIQAFAEKLLIPAIEAHNIDFVKILLDAGVSVSSDCCNSSALYVATELGSEPLIDLLLKRDADITESVWKRAVGYEGLDILKLLVRKGGFERRISYVTLPILEVAASRNDVTVITYLLESDMASLGLLKTYQARVMRSAARGGCVEMIDFLLRQGLFIDATERVPGKYELTPTALAVAAGNGTSDMVLYLLQMGAKANGNLASPQPLFEALDRYHVSEDVVRNLLHVKANPNVAWRGQLPLQLAVSNHVCSFEIISMLLDAGADVHATSTNATKSRFGSRGSDPALKIALERGRSDAVQSLWDRGARFGSWDPLMSTMAGGDENLIEWVLKKLPGTTVSAEHAAKLSVSGGYASMKKLYQSGFFNLDDLQSPEVACYAVMGGDEELFRLLCEAEGFSTVCGAAALAAAAAFQQLTFVQLLLGLGIKPYTRTDSTIQVPGYLQGPFSLAGSTYAILELCRCWDPDDEYLIDLGDEPTMTNNIEIARLLLSSCSIRGEDPAQEEQRLTSLALLSSSAAEWLPLPYFRVLLRSGLELQDVDDRSLLQYALRGSNSEVATYLLEKGATVNCLAHVTMQLFQMPYSGEGIMHQKSLGTALQSAAQHELVDLTRELLQRGADVNASPSELRGATALQYAAMNGNFEIMTMLLEADADINAPPALCDGRTALEGAAEHGRLNMVSFLLDAGTELSGLGYQRAVYRAWKNNHQAVLKVIQDHAQRQGVYETVAHIVQEMTADDLDFWDLDAEDEYPDLFEKVRDERM